MPSLRIVEGPGTGTEITLNKPEITLGRDRDVDVVLLETLVSRKHAKILLEGGHATIVDLNSRNGTFVNRLPIDRHQLVDGDEVSVGETVFIYQETPGGRGTSLVDLQVVPSPGYNEQLTVELPEVQKAVRLQELGHSFENLPQDLRDLAILYEVGRTINSTLNLDEILRHLLDMIFQTIPVARGVVLLRDVSTGKLKPRVTRHRDGTQPQKVKVSETILDYAVQRGLGILSTDATVDDRFTRSESVEAQTVRSMLCVPLKTREETVGVVYVDCPESHALIQKHLLLLNAVANQAAIAIDNARLVDQLRLENRALRRQLNQSHLIVGNSPQMKEIYEEIRRVAPTDATVLLRGESGTGKEVFARAIHQMSRRRTKPFIAVNCASLAPTLLEAEIFGYERGAFTGANERRVGRFELADGGTLFLDEIAEIPPEIQAKLLRVLQEREFERVGGTETVKVDVRIITATNRDLEKALEQGSFREDLYYRLNVIPIQIPPLRERREDIPSLAEHFVKISAQEMGVRPPRISPECLACLMNYGWPGNARELKNYIERAIVLGVEEELLPDHLPSAVRRAQGGQAAASVTDSSIDLAPESLALDANEKKHIEKVLYVCNWNKSRAAELLGISRPRLDRKIKEYGLFRD